MDLYIYHSVLNGIRMSNEEKPRHGATGSYITGFILSLVFTFIPYYLVMNHMLSGNVLIATIITFGLLQAMVQIFFFLHLGREKKPYWQSSFLVATVGAIFVVVVGSMWIMGHLHANMTPVTSVDEAKKLIEDEGIGEIAGVKTGACEGHHQNHKVMIEHGQLSPYQTTAHKCDTLTFINKDSAVREMAFGTHPHHGVYAGMFDVLVSTNRPKSIVLSELGTYNFHDHFDEDVAGVFTVTP